MATALISSAFAIAIDMASRAYYTDKNFPKELQKGYRNLWDALKESLRGRLLLSFQRHFFTPHQAQ